MCIRDRRLGAKDGLVGGDLDVGVDVVDALFGHIHLEPAHRLVGGDDLAVQVGEADFVVVDQVESPDVYKRQARC